MKKILLIVMLFCSISMIAQAKKFIVKLLVMETLREIKLKLKSFLMIRIIQFRRSRQRG